MGIRFFCPNGHKLNVKEFQAGRRGICPFCAARIQIPLQSTRPASKAAGRPGPARAMAQTVDSDDLESAQASDSSPDILPGEPPSLPGDPSGKMLGPSTPVGVPSDSGPVIAPPTLSAGGPAPVAGGRGTLAASTVRPASAVAAAGADLRSAPVRQPVPVPTPSPMQPTPVRVAPAPVVLPTAAAVPGPTVTAAPSVPAAAPGSVPAVTTGAGPALPQATAPEPADPIAEAPEMIWYVRPPSGGQFGPASGDLMRSWLSEGRVSADSLVWREGWRDWLEAGTVFPKLRSNQIIDFLETTPVVAVAAAAAHVHRPKVKRASDRNQIALLVGLSMLVMVLIFVLLWIVFHP